MYLKKLLPLAAIALLSSSAMAQELFNDDWKFHKGDAQGAENFEFNDSKWRNLDLPHDWAIEGPFSSEYNARCGGLPFHGTGWYRKEFTMPSDAKGKEVNIIFDGAMNDAHVWVNGQFVGNRPYGYVSFQFDISQYLNYGDKENVIAVRLQPKDLSSRWYPGAGIYRNVWMSVDEQVNIPLWGTFVTTPTVSDKLAVVQVMTDLENNLNKDSEVKVEYTIYSPSKNVVSTKTNTVTVSKQSTLNSGVWMNVEDPERWDTKSPKLYSLNTKVYSDGKLVDETNTDFGIRTIEFTRDGFFLNGEKVVMNGVCLHHDNGPIGTALNRRADERKLQIMKDMGVNAIRTSHNPVAPEFLDLCDSLGLLVLDELFDCWGVSKTENDYSNHFQEWSERDVTDVLRRDRNHPSVIMWSIGNEIIEQHNREQGWLVGKRLADIVRSVDHTRPSTLGLNNYPQPYASNFAQQVDVVGVNYKPLSYGELREKYPDMLLYGSETSSCTSSRGVYHQPIEKYQKHESLQVTSYDLIGPGWAYPPDVEFDALEKFPFVMGQFIWTGFDYLGEPTPYGGRDNSTNGYWNGDWPSRSAYFGAVDLCGLPKDRFFLYQSVWSDKPMIHLLPHWNWKGLEGQEIPVYAYTNCDEAELFVNGKSYGKRVKGVDLTDVKINFARCNDTIFKSKYRLSWNVPYKAGEIKVVGYKDGKEIVSEEIRTAGKPAKISLVADRNVITADGKDLSYVTVRIEDKDGNLCPNADNLVEFEVEGVGTLRAVGNGNAATMESFQAPRRKAFSGMCMAILNSEKASGEITLKAKSKGLKGATIVVRAQ